MPPLSLVHRTPCSYRGLICGKHEVSIPSLTQRGSNLVIMPCNMLNNCRHTSNYSFYKCKRQLVHNIFNLVSSHLHYSCVQFTEKSQCLCLPHNNQNKNQQQIKHETKFCDMKFCECVCVCYKK